MINLRFKGFRSMITHNILFDLDLNAQHLRLYGMIEQMESCPKTSPWFSYKFIAYQLGLKTRNAAIKVANTLKEKGYIGRKVNRDGNHEWFTIKQKVVASPTEDEDEGSIPDGHPPSIPAGHPPNIPDGHPKSYNNKSHKLKKNLKPPLPPKGDVCVDDSFDKFWDLYPTKKAKKTCREIWKRKKLKDIADEIIGKLRQQVDNDYQWSRGYIPNPTTYLNQERWEDDISNPMPNAESKSSGEGAKLTESNMKSIFDWSSDDEHKGIASGVTYDQ